MDRIEIEDFARSIPGMIPPEQRNAAILLEYLGEAGETIAELIRRYSSEGEGGLIEEIKSLKLEQKIENAAMILLRSVGRHFAEVRGGNHNKSSHFLR